jgi:KDO2-lipid IV(A) lauroyltransferase
LTDYASQILFKFLSFSVRLFPLKLVQRTASFIGLIFFYIIPIRKKVALSNLNICFPEKDSHWKNDITKKSYRNLFIDMFEFMYFPKLNESKIKSFVRFENCEKINASINSEKPVFFASAHFSNWELSALAFPFFWHKNLNIIAKKQTSSGLNNLINEYRCLTGNNIIQTGPSMREIFSFIKPSVITAFLIDQSAHPDYSDYVYFFGKKVSTFSGLSKLALKYEAEIPFLYGVRDENYHYTFYCQKIEYNKEKDSAVDITQKIQNALEKAIKEHPSQWLWFHKRFKHMRND